MEDDKKVKIKLQGLKGDKGDRGEKGDKGDVGEASTVAGPQGAQGFKGEKGDRGEQGFKGDKGDRGDTGEKGDQGNAGKDGSPDTAFEIANKINSLVKEIDWKVLKNVPDNLGGLSFFNRGGAGYLRELSDVSIAGITNGQSIRFNATTNLFEAYTPGSGGGGTWGSITGTLSDQTDLQNALDALEINGTNTQVLYFDGDNNPAGDAGFVWNKLSNILSVYNTDLDRHAEVRSNALYLDVVDVDSQAMTITASTSALTFDIAGVSAGAINFQINTSGIEFTNGFSPNAGSAKKVKGMSASSFGGSTNLNGGDLTIDSGDVVGNGVSKVIIKAGGGNVSGSTEFATINVATFEHNAISLLKATTVTGNISATNLSGTNTGDVSLAGQNYITLAGQVITAAQINLTTHVTGDLSFANLAQGSALSVLGVTGNATADVASIVAGTDHQVLRRSGTALAFGALNLASANAVTGDLPFSNIEQIPNNVVLGNFSGSTADVQQIDPVTLFQTQQESMEFGSSPDPATTYIPLIDYNVGYPQQVVLSDIVGIVQTAIGNTLFGYSGYRLDHEAVSADINVDGFNGLVSVNATGANRTATMTTTSMSASKRIIIMKSDASANTVTVTGLVTADKVITVQYGYVEAVYNGSVFIPLTERL